MGTSTANSGIELEKEAARRRIIEFVKGQQTEFKLQDVKVAAYTVGFYKKLQEQFPDAYWRVTALMYCRWGLNREAKYCNLLRESQDQLKEAGEKLHIQQCANDEIRRGMRALSQEIQELRAQRDALLTRLDDMPAYRIAKERLIQDIIREVGEREAESLGLKGCSLVELHLLGAFPHHQRRLWVALGEYPDYTQRNFAHHLGVSVGRINQMLANLERAGLAKRRDGVGKSLFSHARLPDSVLRLPEDDLAGHPHYP